MFRGTVENIPIDKLRPSPFDIRSDVGDITSLQESIEVEKIRDPIFIAESTRYPDKYDVLDGNRRLKVAQRLGFETVPAIVVQGMLSDNEKLKIAIITNTVRKSLSPRDQARAVYKYVELNPEKSAETIAAEFGISAKQVTGYIDLHHLNKNIKVSRPGKHRQERTKHGEISTDFAIRLARATRKKHPLDIEKQHEAQLSFVALGEETPMRILNQAVKLFERPETTPKVALSMARANARYNVSLTMSFEMYEAFKKFRLDNAKDPSPAARMLLLKGLQHYGYLPA